MCKRFSLIDEVDNLSFGIVRINTLPIPEEIKMFLEVLQHEGYISTDTRIEDFALLFGRPLGESERPRRLIKWMQAKYLLYEFVSAIAEEQNRNNIPLLCWLMFADRTGKNDKLKGIRRRNGIEFIGEKLKMQEIIDRYKPKWNL